MGRLIGIDLGTTNTVAAVAQQKPQVIINELGSRQTPTIVGFTEKGDRVVGEFAKRQLMSHPTNTVHFARRLLGRQYLEVWEDIRRMPYRILPAADGTLAIEVGGAHYAPKELVAVILSTIKRSCESVLGEAVTQAVISAPVSFSDRQRQALRDAGTLAGLEVLRIISEPSAVALAYASRYQKAAKIGIYDFGGSQFDFSIVEVGPQGTQLLANAGKIRLGGADLDLRIIQWLIEEFFTRHLIDVSTQPAAMQRLRDAAERAKLELSSGQQTEIRLPFLAADETGAKHIERTLTRAHFETMVDDLLQQTFDECEKALLSVGLKVEDLDDIVLVGGSSRIPKVEQLVATRFNRTPVNLHNPIESVAIGSALQGFMLSTPASPLPKGASLLLGIGIEHPKGQFYPLVTAGQSLPTDCSLQLTSVGTSATLRILQGNNASVEETTLLGTLAVSGLTPGESLGLTIQLDETGALLADLEAGNSNKTAELYVETLPSFVFTEADSESTADSESEEETEQQREVRKIKHTLIGYVANLEKLRKRHSDRLSPQDISELDAALKRGRMAALKTDDRPAYFTDSLNYIFHYYTNLCNKLRLRPYSVKPPEATLT